MKRKLSLFILGLAALGYASPPAQATNTKFNYEQKPNNLNLHVQQSHHQREQDYIGYRRREELLRRQREENEKMRLLLLELSRRGDYVALGNLLYSRGDVNLAFAAFNDAIKVNPRSSEGYFGRANVKTDREDLAGALADYDRAIEIEPENSAGSYYNRALLKKKLSDKTGAVQDFRIAARMYKSAGNLVDMQSAVNQIKRLETAE